MVEADLLGHLAGVDEVAALQGDAGQAAALQSGRVHQLIGHRAQVLVVAGPLGQAAGPLPRGTAGEPQRQVQGSGGLAAAAPSRVCWVKA
ncbi:hypothetical protein ACE1SV_00330 [Streptomyces sennicomposti]